ncbi:peptidase S8/S53 domain-containing protein [Fusarium oxysporum f. sp. albedinis]|nr:peptidase S8/S53 domain-containing protein [Fusarium oxysporum f. sp. albedinis]
MFLHILLFPWLILVLCSVSNAADTNDTISSPCDRGGLLYTVFLRLSPNANTNVDRIQNALISNHLSPWVEIDGHIISNTIRASHGEISAIRRRPDFERAVRIEPATHETTILQQQEDLGKARYIILPIDLGNQEQCKATNSSLDLLFGTQIEAQMIDGKLHKWRADLSNEQVAQVKAIHGVKGVRPIHKGRRCRLGLKSTNGLEPQAQQEILYETQAGAPTELVSISQPSTIPRLRDLKNYVHENHSGGQSFLYYVETGVAFKAQSEEFPNVASQHLLTNLAIKNGDKPWFDDDDEDENDEDMRSHGTCGAGKALGTRFGVSKKATLIVVRMHEVTSTEFEAALELIIADLEDHPERRKKSVVTMSLTMGQGWEDDNLRDFRKLFQGLFAKYVPLVCISGNIDEGFEEPDVDEYPALMEGPDMPLIVVGSVDSTGNRSEFSKGGAHVTLHAVGDPIDCLPKDSKDPVERAGTSYAGPQVAGEIANLLSYEEVPFDTSDGNLVKNLKAYLQSDAASWERYPGIRVLWNGVREENNPKEAVKCNGLESDKYVEREEVKRLIENEFCPEVGSWRDLRQQGSAISRTYNIDTPNKVTLSVSLDQGDSASDCVKYLMMTVDDCYRIDNDPSNYKGGGQTIIGDATYEVYPDHGEELKKEVKGCALLPDTWKFTYGLGDDGREWTARFRTGVFQKQCVGNAVGKASGFGNFGCARSG